MAATSVLVDTGPLVAIHSPRDPGHARCIEMLGQLHAPLHTCWPVLTEAAWLLQGDPESQQRLFRNFATGSLALQPLDAGDIPAISRILLRYADLRPDFADACLVHLAEREGISTIFTLDRRDFAVYRTTRGRAFKLLP